MDHRAVPGILLSSQPMAKPAASLKDLGSAVLAEFGVEAQFPVPQDSE